MRLLGTTTDITTCECCGKKNLKKSIALLTSSDDVVYYGSDCAGRALLGKKTASNTKTINKRVEAIELAKRLIDKYPDNLKQAETGVWNKHGYPCQVVKGKFIIADFGCVELEVK